MNGWIPILSYHRICEAGADGDPLGLCIPPRRLEQVLRHFSRRGYRFATLDAAVAALDAVRPRQRHVCLTFDDGYTDFYTQAFPLLQKYNATATLFVVSSCIGGTNRWDEGYGLAPLPLLSASQIRALDAAGIAIGSHSVSHPRLTALNERARNEEIAGSKKALEELLEHEVSFFCYPHADHNAAVRAAVREAGYLGACGGEQAEHERFLLHRVDVAQVGWPLALFRLSGWRYSLQRSPRLRGLKRRLLPTRRAAVEVMEAKG